MSIPISKDNELICYKQMGVIVNFYERNDHMLSNHKGRFSRKAIWQAVNSEFGDRLIQIAVEHTKLVKAFIEFQHGVDAEIIEARIVQLREERDGIIEMYEGEDDDDTSGTG